MVKSRSVVNAGVDSVPVQLSETLSTTYIRRRMMRTVSLVGLIALAFSALHAIAQTEPVSFVNEKIGTAHEGQTFLGCWTSFCNDAVGTADTRR